MLAREQELRLRLDELRRALMLKAGQCPREEPAPSRPPLVPPQTQHSEVNPEKPEIPPLADLLPRTSERENELNPQTRPQVRRETELTPERRPENTFEPGDELRIPDEARNSNDPSFLQGCWLSATNIYNSETGEALVAEYCFDREGRGTRTVQKENGEACTGPVQARFDDRGRLIIESGIADCDDGGGYVPQEVECSGSGDSVDCRGQEISPQALSWQAGFRRK
jgi:hypothetical protein